MNRAQHQKAYNALKKRHQKEINQLIKGYIKSSVPMKKGVVYESPSKPKKGLTTRFVVFIFAIQYFREVDLFDAKAGVWWLDKEGKCTKWETLSGVDNPNHGYVKSKDQSYIKPEKITNG